jgi:hypothetical protein
LTSVATPPPAARSGRLQMLPFAAALVGGGVVLGLAAGELVAGGHSTAVAGLAVLLLPVMIWKRPHLGPVVILAAALLIEQFVPTVLPAEASGPAVSAVTPLQIPITSSIPLFGGIGSLHIQGTDLLILTVSIIYLAKSVEWGPRWWPRSQVSMAVIALLGAVVVGVVIGLTHHGSLRAALMETRPFIYLGATYVLAAVLLQNRSALRTALWALVIADAFKAVQGLYLYLQTRHLHPPPETLLGHEEGYLFALFILLVLALWLFDVPGRLRSTATWLLPLVIAADLVNNRRAAWLVLGGGVLTLLAITYRTLPSRRRTIARSVAAALAISAVYFPLYWNKMGGLAQPARAIHSQISPDPRDSASDTYRTQEDANLKFNIAQGGLIGKGFGVPIDYALPIVNIRKIDPNIIYVPHNGVYYILMRLGLLGGVAFWGLLAAGIIAGCRLARCVDRELAAIGAVVACALIAYALEGATDQGFFFYRIALVTGSLLGMMEAARRIWRNDARATSTGLRVIPSEGPSA